MSDRLKPIKNERITDQVFNSLVDMLMSGELKPGDRLPTESTIAERLGAGRNSVREAMKALQVLGVVERRQGYGSVVVDPNTSRFEPLLIPIAASISDANDLVELRSVFEVGTVDLVIDTVPDEGLEDLRKKMEHLEELARAKPFSAEEAVEADMAFHVTMAEMTGNRALIALSRLIMRLFKSSMTEALSQPHRLEETIADHRAFFDAIRRRQKDTAKQIIRRSFERWKQSVRIQN